MPVHCKPSPRRAYAGWDPIFGAFCSTVRDSLDVAIRAWLEGWGMGAGIVGASGLWRWSAAVATVRLTSHGLASSVATGLSIPVLGRLSGG